MRTARIRGEAAAVPPGATGAAVLAAQPAQPLDVELPGCNQQLGRLAAVGRRDPEAAPLDVGACGGRQEQLTLGEPHDGLVRAQQRERSAAVVAKPADPSPRAFRSMVKKPPPRPVSPHSRHMVTRPGRGDEPVAGEDQPVRPRTTIPSPSGTSRATQASAKDRGTTMPRR
jgi:hypothetical protein